MRIHMLAKDVKTLGPGRRYGIWLQGCLRRCPGCTTPESWDKNAGFDISVDEIVAAVANDLPDGITISGGEPFLQPEELSVLVSELKSMLFPIIVYTGYKYESLLELGKTNQSILDVLSNIDVLIDGEYVIGEDHGEKWRGSANQRFIMLSNYYDPTLFEGTGREVEFRIVDNVISMVGVPSESAKDIMKRIKERN